MGPYVKKYNNEAISKAKVKLLKYIIANFDIRLNEITKMGHYKYSVSKEYIIKSRIHKGKGIIVGEK